MPTKENTDEYKASNKKKIKVNGKEKWLLMDDEETSQPENVFSESELDEIIDSLVAESIEELLGKS